MNVELLRVTTADGMRLDGALHRPRGTADPALGIDALLCIHGTGGSFYSSTLLDAFAEHFVEHGCAVLAVNTRGHDLVSTAATDEGPRRQGAAYERVDDCRHDLRAWTDALPRAGFTRTALVGHSLGAVKAVYALSQPAPLAALRLVAVSPPRLSCSYFTASARSADFLKALELAQSHVANGRPRELMQVEFPLPYLVTAEGYLDKYGPAERYNVLKLIGKVACPTLVTLGGLEVQSNVAFMELPDELASAANGNRVPNHRRADVETAVIDGADHFYSGRRAELVACVDAWLRQTREANT